MCRFHEANMEFVRKKAWDRHKIKNKVRGSLVQACENYSDLPTRQLKRKLSHLGQIANMKIKKSLWTAAHLST